MYVDIHAHYSYYKKDSQLIGKSLLTAHHADEIDGLVESCSNPLLYRAVGVHPQDPDFTLMDKVEQTVNTPMLRARLHAIGEIGFDLWHSFKEKQNEQMVVFTRQLELASRYNLPIVIHQRKAMHLIFSFHKELRKVPAVIFHSYSGTLQEALSLRKKGINAYFSIGTPILWGSKIAQEIAVKLPLEWLFIETDAPFQPVRGQEITYWHDLICVYRCIADLRSLPVEQVALVLNGNFDAIFKKANPL